MTTTEMEEVMSTAVMEKPKVKKPKAKKSTKMKAKTVAEESLRGYGNKHLPRDEKGFTGSVILARLCLTGKAVVNAQKYWAAVAEANGRDPEVMTESRVTEMAKKLVSTMGQIGRISEWDEERQMKVGNGLGAFKIAVKPIEGEVATDVSVVFSATANQITFELVGPPVFKIQDESPKIPRFLAKLMADDSIELHPLVLEGLAAV